MNNTHDTRKSATVINQDVARNQLTFEVPQLEGQEAPLDMLQAMATVADIFVDGTVTVSEAGDLLALFCPHLADHPELAGVLQLADSTVRELRKDGNVTPGELFAIVVPLLTHGAKVIDLGNLAQTIVSGVFKPLKWLTGAEKKSEQKVEELVLKQVITEPSEFVAEQGQALQAVTVNVQSALGDAAEKAQEAVHEALGDTREVLGDIGEALTGKAKAKHKGKA